MGDHIHPSTKFTWIINGFTGLTEGRHYSGIFLVGGTAWKMYINRTRNVVRSSSIYLCVADSETLPTGWNRKAKYRFTLVNQHNRSLSITKRAEHMFMKSSYFGFSDFVTLGELERTDGGFLVNDALVVEVEVEVISVHPSVIDSSTHCLFPAASTSKFDSFFVSVEEEFINKSTNSTPTEGLTIHDSLVLIPKTPSLEEVERAKQSLKQCLSDLFKPNMKERLSKALITLAKSKDGLLPDQRETVTIFWGNFDDFVSDFLIFQQDNSEFELQKLLRDNLFNKMKMNHEAHLSYKQSLSDISKEEDELMNRIEDLKSRKMKLISDWESLLVESSKVKSDYKSQEKKIADAEEKMKIAEERMSRSATAWANLKRHFG